MHPKRYIVWSKNNIDLEDPFQKLWYIRQVLTRGRAEDIAGLDREEVKKLLHRLKLPTNIHRLWENYFASQR